MATIYNYCDLLLQATTPRLTVTAVTILPGNSGFLKPKNTLSLTPGSILLNTTIVGFTDPVYSWYYAVSTAPTTFIFLVSGTSATGHNQYPVSNTTFLTHVGSGNSVIYKCKVTQTGWADAESTTTLTYTKQNNDIPVATLNKTSIILPTTVADVVDYSNSGSRITVSIGGTNIPYAASGAGTFSVDTAISSGTIVVDTTPETEIATNTRVYDNLSGMAAGNAPATITYTVTARDVDGVATIIPLTQTISKAVSGDAGIAYWLVTSASAIQKSITNAYNPATITVSGYSAAGTNSPALYAGRFKIYENGSATAAYQSSANESTKTYTPSGTGVTSIKIEFYLAGGFTTELDEQTIPMVFDGATGANAITAVLSNESANVPATSGGTVTNFAGASTIMSIYEGATDTSASWTYLASYSNVTSSTLNTSRTQTINGLSASTGYVDITASRAGYSSITKRFNVTKTFAGADSTVAGPTGASNYRIYIKSTNQATVPTTPSNTIDGGTPAGWSTGPVALSGVEAQFQSDGLRAAGATPGTSNTVWGTPYLSYFKVATLEAITANLGNINAGTITGITISGTTITGGTVTGSTVQTNSTGARLIMGGPTWNTSLVGFNTAGGQTLQINASAGQISSSNYTGTGPAASFDNSSNSPAIYGANIGTGTGGGVSANSTNGFGLEAYGSTNRGTIYVHPLPSLPTGILSGGLCVYNNGLYFCNGTSWVLIS